MRKRRGFSSHQHVCGICGKKLRWAVLLRAIRASPESIGRWRKVTVPSTSRRDEVDASSAGISPEQLATCHGLEGVREMLDDGIAAVVGQIDGHHVEPGLILQQVVTF